MNKSAIALSFTLPLVHRAGLAALCSAACLAWPALAQGQAQPVVASSVRSADFIVAVVNSEPVTNQEVISRMQRLVRVRVAPEEDCSSMPVESVV